MNEKLAYIQKIIPSLNAPQKSAVHHFAPVNIALVKYWGKRNEVLNLPRTSSLSLTLTLGTHTTLRTTENSDKITLNGTEVSEESSMSVRTKSFLDLFRPKGVFFEIDTRNDIPTGAGLASSASGCAALVLCLNDLFGWGQDRRSLSLLARLASGSACRSLFTGFVKWHQGFSEDGLDSFAEPMERAPWPDLCCGLWILSSQTKPIDSRSAMNHTTKTSGLYKAWPEIVEQDLEKVSQAIHRKDFTLLGQTIEQNALSMHATMLAASPAVLYMLPETIQAMHTIWSLRKSGLELYFTMDAGPNVKVICRKQDCQQVLTALPNLQFVPLLF